MRHARLWLIGLAGLALVLTGCQQTPAAGPVTNIAGNGNCVINGNGDAGRGTVGDGGVGSPGGTGNDCRPVSPPVLSPVPVVAIEKLAAGGGSSQLTAPSVDQIIQEFKEAGK
jgi:hypothetical protein